MRGLSEQEKEFLIRHIEDNRGGRFAAQSDYVLANLGDANAIQRLYDRNVAGLPTNRPVFGRVTHPHMFVVTGDDILKAPHEFEGGSEDRIWLNRRSMAELAPPFSIAVQTLRIVKEWPEFPPQVRMRADEVLQDMNWGMPETYLEDVRVFWQVNREKLWGGQYGEVVPLLERYGVSAPPPLPATTRIYTSEEEFLRETEPKHPNNPENGRAEDKASFDPGIGQAEDKAFNAVDEADDSLRGWWPFIIAGVLGGSW
jgi:hypothetical protein